LPGFEPIGPRSQCRNNPEDETPAMPSMHNEYQSMVGPAATAAALGYLALLAISAWRQGELIKFGVSLLVLAALVGGLAAIAAGYIYVLG
jgi:hypothetical protein